MTTLTEKKARRAPLVACALLSLVLAGCRVSSEPVGTVLLDQSKGINHVNDGTFEARPDGTLVWPGHYFGILAHMDWSGYDFVELTLYNSGSQAVPFSFEVKDNRSSDYWTRVNLSQILGPGLQTIRLPTRLRVGETGRPGRPLDPSNVVSLILARDDKNDQVPVEVRRIELKKSAVAAVPGILALHAGPEDAGIPDGFQALTEKTAYEPGRGWGWVSHEFWAPYPQVNRVIAPDRLTASNLAISSAKLRVDLKPGAYKVWMIIDHPGGFWGEYPYYHHRVVKAQGKIALDERMNPEQAKAEYFRWQDAEDAEGEDLFDLYWSKILKEKSFDTRVENGHLDLEFLNEDCPGRIPCFGLALSALVIYPSSTAAERARGELWLDRLREARRAEFHNQYQLKGKPLTALLGAMPPGLKIWDAPSDVDLSQEKFALLRPLPDSGRPVPRVSVFRNAREFFAPGVSWKGKDLQEIGWRLEGVPEGIEATGGWIKYRALRESYTGNLYTIRERWVTDQKERVFSSQTLGRLWLRFQAPREARPGVYAASLTFTAKGTGEIVRVPFELRVLKAQADDLDFPVGPFQDNIAENWWDDGVLRPRLEQLQKQSLTALRALGMTAFSFSPKLRVSAEGAGVSVNSDEVDRMMALAAGMGFKGLVGYGDVIHGENLCERPGGDSALKGADGLKQVTDALDARARARHWLPLALIACDEPVGAAVHELIERLEDMPKGDPQQPVQWSVTTSLGRNASSETRKLVGQIGLPFLTEFSPGEIRFPWAYYNNSSRDALGLGMFRLRQTTDLRYRLLWIWNQNMSNPYFDFDSREADAAWCSSTAAADLRCSVPLDRVINRGLTDYRVALALKRVLSERKDLPAALSQEGQELLKQAMAEGTDAGVWLSKVAEYQEKL